MCKIAIVKEAGILREGITTFLQEELPNHHIAAYSYKQQDLLFSETGMVDLLIIDMDNINDVPAVINRFSKLAAKIVVWTSEMKNTELTELFKLGIHGYFYNGMGTSEILYAVKSILDGGQYIHPNLTPILLNEYKSATGKKCTHPSGLLTGREWEVLEQIVEGANNELIAGNLYISLTTVNNHVRSILAKLKVADRTNAVLLALRNNWFSL